MNTLATYIEKIAPFLWEGRGSVSGEGERYREIKHPTLPLVLYCQFCGRTGGSIAFNAMLPREVGGTYHHRSLAGTGDAKAPKTRRAISLHRFEDAPERVAREIERHVSDPAEPLALKALKLVADRYALEHRITSIAENLSDRHGLRLYTLGSDTMYLSNVGRCFDREAWGDLRIDRHGYFEIKISHLSIQKAVELVDFLCAGGSSK